MCKLVRWVIQQMPRDTVIQIYQNES